MTEMNITICPACRGTKVIRTTAVDPPLEWPCPTCRGTGKIDRTAPGFLESGAETYRERNKTYGDSYHQFGKVMMALFPDGLPDMPISNHPRYWNRVGILNMMISKLCRYSSNFDKPHSDSIHDIMVYAAMLQELDQNG